MNRVKLYSYWRSSASYRVRIALNLKQIDYDIIPVHLLKDGGGQRKREYQQLNPAMLVPTFVDEDNDLVLNQSLAIIEYIDSKYPDINPLLPKDALDKARVKTLCYDIACDIQPIANLRILQKLELDFAATDKQRKLWAKEIIGSGFDVLEQRLLMRSGQYTFDYSLSMADVCLVPQIYNAKRFGINMNEYPRLKKVYENCMSLKAFAQASPECQIDAE